MCCSPSLPAPSRVLSPVPYAMVAPLQSGSALQFWQPSLCPWLRIIMVHSSLATPPFHGPLCPVLSLNRDRIVTISLKLFDVSQIDDFSALHSSWPAYLHLNFMSLLCYIYTGQGNHWCALSSVYVHLNFISLCYIYTGQGTHRVLALVFMCDLQSLFGWAFTSSAAPGLFISAFSSDLRIAALPWNSHRYCWELKFSFSFFKSLYPILKVLT